jgi:2'-5' RNA ligase
MIRLFVGLALAPSTAARLEALGAGIPGARWVAPHNLHVTLRFIGEVDEGSAQDIHHGLEQVAAPGFDLTLDGFGTFGSRRPHTLWAGVARDAGLERLQGRVEAAVVQAGLPPEPRKFTPHVTLAKLEASSAPRLPEFISRNSPFRAGPDPVDRFVLFQSFLSRNGADYQVVAEYSLEPLPA